MKEKSHSFIRSLSGIPEFPSSTVPSSIVTRFKISDLQGSEISDSLSFSFPGAPEPRPSISDLTFLSLPRGTRLSKRTRHQHPASLLRQFFLCISYLLSGGESLHPYMGLASFSLSGFSLILCLLEWEDKRVC